MNNKHLRNVSYFPPPAYCKTSEPPQDFSHLFLVVLRVRVVFSATSWVPPSLRHGASKHRNTLCYSITVLRSPQNTADGLASLTKKAYLASPFGFEKEPLQRLEGKAALKSWGIWWTFCFINFSSFLCVHHSVVQNIMGTEPLHGKGLSPFSQMAFIFLLGPARLFLFLG